METARREAPADIEWPKLDGHHGIYVLDVPLGSPGYVEAYMRDKAELESVIGRCSFNATSSARRYDHFPTDARGSANYAAAVHDAWGRLQAATVGHLSEA
eukprot:jgi/Tetstr1/424583/TSEL_015108.t1